MHDEEIPLNIIIQDTLSGVAHSSIILDGQTDLTGKSSFTAALGTHTITVESVDTVGNNVVVTVSFAVALKSTMLINPETINVNTGIITAFVEFPEGYDVSTVNNVYCDGALAESYVYDPKGVPKLGIDGPVMIIKFRRDDITDLPLDVNFKLRGTFGPENTVFKAEDDVTKIL